jgi:hypothetical protein
MITSIPNDFQTELWSEDEISIFEQFRFRCINCDNKAIVLHELIPKSKLKDWKRDGNRVPLCLKCHEWAHKFGTRRSRLKLSAMRDFRLDQYANN